MKTRLKSRKQGVPIVQIKGNKLGLSLDKEVILKQLELLDLPLNNTVAIVLTFIS